MSHSLIVSPCATPLWRWVSPSKAYSPVQATARSSMDVKVDAEMVTRRGLVIGLSGVGVSMVSAEVGWNSAMAASRRTQPPPSPEEKNDPNISGVQAKILASKKRKEAMKKAVAKLREKGKSVE